MSSPSRARLPRVKANIGRIGVNILIFFSASGPKISVEITGGNFAEDERGEEEKVDTEVHSALSSRHSGARRLLSIRGL